MDFAQHCSIGHFELDLILQQRETSRVKLILPFQTKDQRATLEFIRRLASLILIPFDFNSNSNSEFNSNSNSNSDSLAHPVLSLSIALIADLQVDGSSKLKTQFNYRKKSYLSHSLTFVFVVLFFLVFVCQLVN